MAALELLVLLAAVVKQAQAVLERLLHLADRQLFMLVVAAQATGLTAYPALPALAAMVAAVRVVLLEIMALPAQQILVVVVGQQQLDSLEDQAVQA